MPPADARWRLGIACAAVMLSAADTYVVVLALTSIIADVGIPVDQLQRAAPIVSGFLLGYVAMLPLLGRLSDLYGRQPVFTACLAVFATGSMITASAHDLSLIVAGRTLQGLGGGGVVPITLALVADVWPPGRRGLPLGIVGASQEVGSVLGPLAGAVIVTVSTWRTIFWVNLAIALTLGAGFIALREGTRQGSSPMVSRASRAVATGDGRERGRFDLVGSALAGVAGLAVAGAVIAPAPLVDSYTIGALYTPIAGADGPAFLTPLAMVGAAAIVLLAGWELVLPPRFRPLLPLRGLPAVVRRIDWLGSTLLAAVLGIIVIVFAVADPSRQVIAPGAGVLLPVALLLTVLFIVHERRARDPVVPFGALSDRAAIGALLTNVAIGAALIAAVVDVPIFARETTSPDSQIGAAFVLLRLLVAIPIGALAGGLLCERIGYRLTAAAGMLASTTCFVIMSRWSAQSLGDPLVGVGWLHPADPVLALCGLGFGLAIAPVNAALLATVRETLHGLASALVVVARSVGMLVGLSLLTAIGLRSFYSAVAGLVSPLHVCPEHPSHCPAYDSQVTAAVIDELHTIYGGAAACAAVAGLCALLLLRRRTPAGAHTGVGPATPPRVGWTRSTQGAHE